MEFERGVNKTPLKSIGTTDKRGTTVRFKPDPEIFTQTREFMFDIIADRMRELAFLNPEITVVLTDERDKDLDNNSATFHYPCGVKDYVSYLDSRRHLFLDDSIHL